MLQQNLARLAFKSLGTVAPSRVARVAERIYFTPRRHRMPQRERALLEDAERFTIEGSAGAIAAFAWSPRLFPWEPATERGTVLLVHGWEGRGAQLGAFAAPLVAAGLRVVAIDAPAHGQTARHDGEQTDVLAMRDAIVAAVEHLGDVKAIIAHSAGCPATVLAVAEGVDVDAIALVSPPHSFDGFARRFAELIGLPESAEQLFRARIEDRFGKDVWTRFALPNFVAQMGSIRGLVVHDENDVEVPVLEGARVADAWPGARMVTTSGLGHRRILRDTGVVDEITRFIAR